jgi:hypothetical protein
VNRDNIHPEGSDTEFRLIWLSSDFFFNTAPHRTCRKTAHLEIPEEVHGSVYNDGFFGYGFTWSSDERYIAYCAEVRFLSNFEFAHTLGARLDLRILASCGSP